MPPLSDPFCFRRDHTANTMLKFQDNLRVKSSKQETAIFKSHPREEARCEFVLANYPARSMVNIKWMKYFVHFMEIIRTTKEKNCYSEAL